MAEYVYCTNTNLSDAFGRILLNDDLDILFFAKKS